MDYEDFNNKRIIDIFSKFGNPAQIRVLYVSTYIPRYIRTESILDILRRNKIRVEVIQAANTKFRYLPVFFRMILRLKQNDIIFLGFRSHEILPFFRFFTRKPIIFDAFVSSYDTLCFDRKIFKPDSIIGRFLKFYDRYLCKKADLVLVDTKAHSEYFKREFGANNISYLYLESNKTSFRTRKTEKSHDKFTVFWYGKCWPLQGVDVILQAAEILKDEADVIFRLVGPVRDKYNRLINKLNCGNIEFVDSVAYEDLPGEIAKADICLGGHFSAIPKAKRVIPGKAFHFISCGKKTILGDNPANRELFEEGEGIYFLEMNSAQALAKTILRVRDSHGC
ncbi:glycosyltransferase [Candidatus Omnitrophota bacterium]